MGAAWGRAERDAASDEVVIPCRWSQSVRPARSGIERRRPTGIRRRESDVRSACPVSLDEAGDARGDDERANGGIFLRMDHDGGGSGDGQPVDRSAPYLSSAYLWQGFRACYSLSDRTGLRGCQKDDTPA